MFRLTRWCLLACLALPLGAQQTTEPVAETHETVTVRRHASVLRHVGASRQRYRVPTVAAVPASSARQERAPRAASLRHLRLRR